MHTKHSDGTDSVVRLLEKAGNAHLEMISITDHNSVKAYYDIQKLGSNRSLLYKGLLMKGCEFTTSFEGRNIEILGYHINIDQINAYLQKRYSPKKKRQDNKKIYQMLCQILDRNGVIYNKKNIKISLFSNDFIENKFYKEIIKHEENKENIKEDILTLNTFFRKGLSNPESAYYMDYTAFHAPLDEVLQAIHDAGGVAILAHPYQYTFHDIEAFIDKIMALHKIDGLECFYPTFTEEQTRYLTSYCIKYDLLMSGGSDYHGKAKPEYHLGTGFGNLTIQKEIVSTWIEKANKKPFSGKFWD